MPDAPETPNLEGKAPNKLMDTIRNVVASARAAKPQEVSPDLPSGGNAEPNAPNGKEPKAKAGQGADQADDTESTSGGSQEKEVPLRHLLEERAAKKAALAEKETMAKKVADLEAQLTAKKDAESIGDMALPDGFQEWEPIKQQAWVAAWVSEQKINSRIGKDGLQRLASLDVQADLERNGVRVNQAQAEAVNRVQKEMPNLSAVEALALATVRDAEVFTNGANGAPPPSHMVSTPKSGPRTTATKATVSDLNKALVEIKSKQGREALVRDFIAKNILHRN